jgi:hypothetical protein
MLAEQAKNLTKNHEKNTKMRQMTPRKSEFHRRPRTAAATVSDGSRESRDGEGKNLQYSRGHLQYAVPRSSQEEVLDLVERSCSQCRGKVGERNALRKDRGIRPRFRSEESLSTVSSRRSVPATNEADTSMAISERVG